MELHTLHPAPPANIIQGGREGGGGREGEREEGGREGGRQRGGREVPVEQAFFRSEA